jgi:murein DD-endopeptidase MepM/ murein hydrolase activator NlpD
MMGIGGVIGLGLAVWTPKQTTEIGAIAPVLARPAELAEVRSVSSGETLDQALGDYIPGTDRQQVVLAFQEQASPRRIQPGTEVTLRWRAADHWLRGVDVVLNPDSTVRLTRDELGWRSAVVQTPIWTDTLYATGTIKDVLWNAVVQNPALGDVPVHDRALLIDHLDQVFQWQVDFSRQIQPGDTYRFAFERQVRPDGSMRAGHLLAAELMNAGTKFAALWFQTSGADRGSYYGPDGKSVRRSFLLKPLEFKRISSRFTNARFHPILGLWRAHQGTDYAAAAGTPIQATGDGVVTHRGPMGALGNAVVIKHPNGYVTRYGHMSRFEPTVKEGTRVHQGQVIGFVGMTGLATGPHLHYEFWIGGKPVDPLSVNLPPGDPVGPEDSARWQTESSARLALLDRVRRPTVLASADAGR